MKLSTLAGLLCACTLAAQPNAAGGSVEGRVINSVTRAPVRKATVTLSGDRGRLVDQSDAEGTFHFTGLPPGSYRLSAGRAGFLDRQAGRLLVLAANDAIKDAELRLPPECAITGRVLDEDGDPVPRAVVMIFKQVYRNGGKQWEPIATNAETTESGAYRVPSLKPGTYIVQAMDRRPQVSNQFGKLAQAFYVPMYYPNSVSRQQAVPIPVGTGADAEIDIHLVKIARAPNVRVKGRVTGIPANSPLVVSVGASAADGNPFGGGSTQTMAPDYIFELNIPPGEYLIRGNVYSGGLEMYGSAAVTVAGDLDGVVLPMRPAPEISAHITIAEGGPVNLKDVQMKLAATSSSMATGEFALHADAAGRFGAFPNLVRRPGHFTVVRLESLPDGYFVRELKLGGQEISPNDFEIQSSTQLEVVLSNKAGKIAGSVLDAAGKPVPGSTVTLIPSEGSGRPAKIAADDGGAFQFTNLRPGKYSMFAWEGVDDDLWQDPDFRKKFADRATEVSVGEREARSAQLHVIPADAVE